VSSSTGTLRHQVRAGELSRSPLRQDLGRGAAFRAANFSMNLRRGNRRRTLLAFRKMQEQAEVGLLSRLHPTLKARMRVIISSNTAKWASALGFAVRRSADGHAAMARRFAAGLQVLPDLSVTKGMNG